jgi:hypothetical protein
MNLEERFWAKVRKGPDCWLWTACKDSFGYGRLNVNGKMVGAHRFSWELQRGKIPEGLHVLHHCDVGGCVNPDHLYIGTNQDNTNDKMERGRHVAVKGEEHGCAKLCETDVLLIRDLAETKTYRAIADWFNISRTHVSDIVNCRKWKHI